MPSQTSTVGQPEGSPQGHSQRNGRSQHRRSAVPSIRSLLEPSFSLSPHPSQEYFELSRSHPAPLHSSQEFVDLTNDSDSPSSPDLPTSRHRMDGEPARKRRRINEGGDPQAGSSQTQTIDVEALGALDAQGDSMARSTGIRSADESDGIEEVDLSHVQGDMDLKKHQAEQRRRHMEMQEQQNQLVKDSVTAQQSENAGPTSLSRLSCIICMESMTDMTATHCGHIFCHTCIMEALIAGERQGHEPGKGLSRCPVCRKKVLRSQGKTKDPQQVIPLEIKFIRRSEKSKGKQRDTGENPLALD